MKVLIINNNTSFLEELIEILKDFEYEIIDFKDFKEKDAERFTHIILTGGDEKLDFDLFSEEKKLIENSEKPILGICFGYQLIVKIFGGEPVKMNFKRQGYFDVKILKKDLILEGLEEIIKIYQSHWYFMKYLGKELICLGESNFGIEIIKHRDRKLYGVQFHPEVKSQDGKIIIDNFLRFS
jgi:GMP synthase (glutamine-hydrolysing)